MHRAREELLADLGIESSHNMVAFMYPRFGGGVSNFVTIALLIVLGTLGS
jgi:hypothetical protein